MDFAWKTQESHRAQTHYVKVENGHFGMHTSALRKTHPEDPESSHKYQGGENTGEAKTGTPF